VFDAMLEKAMRLCEAKHGYMYTHNGERLRTTAVRGERQFVEFMRGREPLIPGTPLERAIRNAGAVYIPDCVQEEVYRTSPGFKQLVDMGGIRAGIILPLFKEAAFLGSIHIFRQEVRPFADKQIALLQNFAAQAVIAIENARLITETREALEQQTATAEVFQVINSSPRDVAPIFDIMLEKAMRLCETPAGYLLRYEDGIHSLAAGRGISQDLARFMAHMPQPQPQEAQIQILEGAPYVHVHDLKDSDAYRSGTALRRAAVDLGGLRTGLAVPLLKDGRVLGNFCLARYKVEPFTEKQISLLQGFATQAVIAMENARLLTETREALEQQTATAEVLQVINSSPGDLAPVFESILENAHALCGATKGSLVAYDGERYRTVASRGLSAAYAKLLRELRRGLGPSNSPFERLLRGESLVQIPDLRTENDQISRAAAELEGARTVLFVPLRKDGALLGYMTAYRQEVRRFSEKQIAFLQNFAAQAVIAMENARLITETREALEQQTATADVLQVINASPGDLGPVFDSILDKAQCVCGVEHAALELYDGQRFYAVAVRGASDKFAETLRHGYRATDSPAGRAMLEGQRFAQIADAAQIDHIAFRTASEVDGIRTVLFVPLRRDDTLLGMIASARREVRPFSEKEIALLENLAAQAVIAMENARLITETREALDQQTATPRCCRSSIRRPVISLLCSPLCSKRRPGSAKLILDSYPRTTEKTSPRSPHAACRKVTEKSI
jgi:GAF domain-containing protein